MSCQAAPSLGNSALFQLGSVHGVGTGARVVLQQGQEPNSVAIHSLHTEPLVAMCVTGNTNTSQPTLSLAPDFASALGWF